MRTALLATAIVASLGPSAQVPAASLGGIIPETTARRLGLTRPWFTQIQMDPGRSRVSDVVLYSDMEFHKDTLYVQTDRAMVHAIDAETGQTLWARQVGRPNHPSLAPGVSSDLLAVVNGSRLYVCNRFNGDVLFELEVRGAPGAGAALSEQRAYVPMVDGMVKAYRLEPVTQPAEELGIVDGDQAQQEEAATEQQRRQNIRIRQQYVPPLTCKSLGRALVQPLVTRQTEAEEFVTWPTDRGYLYFGRIDRSSEDSLAIRYRLETRAGIAARPTYLPPDPAQPDDSGVIFAASRDGFVYAIAEENGDSLWQFSAGEPIVEPAVVVRQRVFVATQLGGMYCLDAKTGQEQWWAPKVKQFIAASKQRIYAADKLGRILILNGKTGGRIDALPAIGLPIKMINSQTDRIYLATRTGILQCLHEVELGKPLRHGQARVKAPKAGQAGAEEPVKGKAEPQPVPADQQDPFGDAPNPFEGGGNESGGPEPEDNPFANNNPFD